MKVYLEIAKKLASLRCADGTVPIAGLCAPAGGGKSTLVQILRLILEQVLHIGQVVEVSLDDFLSSQQERKERTSARDGTYTPRTRTWARRACGT